MRSKAAAVGCIEIDDVAQQHPAFIEGVTPTEKWRRTSNGLSRMAPSITSRPASMRFAIATSPSRDKS